MHATADARDADDDPRADQFVVLHEVAWADYERILKIRGDRSAPRIAYAEGELEIMSPSRHHESIKSLIGRLVETYCLAAGIDFATYGSWTLKKKKDRRGVEPDECYVFGAAAARKPTRPDLAIEVEWSSGGILDKLDLYRALGVREVWRWRRGIITPHVLRGGTYRQVTASRVLPGIVLPELVSFFDRPTTGQAVRAYRDALARRRLR